MTLDVKFLTPSQVKALCQDLQIRPTKQLGQNFVMDPSTVQKIVQAAELKSTGVRVLEVGPGLGSLTLGLLAAGAQVTCVELDKRLAYYLPQTLQNLAANLDESRWKILSQDALTLRADQVDQPEYLVSNLPYNVAVPVILHCLETFPSIKKVLVMVQKEVALRLSATPGNKLYGVPSVKTAWYGKASLAGEISRNVFYPIPNVDSTLVAIDIEPKYDSRYREATFAVIDAAFHNRRKMLRSVLKKWAGNADLEAMLRQAGISPQARGETLQVEDFYRLAKIHAAQENPDHRLGENQARALRKNQARAQAPGKINLCLYLTGQAPNGKHYLETVFQGVELYSTVTITRSLPAGEGLANKVPAAKDATGNAAAINSPVATVSNTTPGLDIGDTTSRETADNASVAKAGTVQLEVDFKAPAQAYHYDSRRDREALAGLAAEENLAVKAWRAFAKRCQVNDAIHLQVDKEIPVAAGMAGGSADAAATLLAANELYGFPLTQAELCELAATLGADVPFGILGGIVKGLGFGDQVESIKPLAVEKAAFPRAHAPEEKALEESALEESTPEASASKDFTPEESVSEENASEGSALAQSAPENTPGADISLSEPEASELAQRHFVAVVSPQLLSTPKVFQTWHELDLPYSSPGSLSADAAQHYAQAEPAELQLHNDLEPASLKLLPELTALKRKCLELGALQVLVSGSGPTLACLCADAASQTALAQALAKEENVAYTLCVNSQKLPA